MTSESHTLDIVNIIMGCSTNITELVTSWVSKDTSLQAPFAIFKCGMFRQGIHFYYLAANRFCQFSTVNVSIYLILVVS